MRCSFFVPNKAGRLLLTSLVALLSVFSGASAEAACGATTRTWDGGNGTNGTNGNYYGTASVWDTNNAPDTGAENAVIPSAGVGYMWLFPADFTVGCVHVTAGLLGFWANTLIVQGDYFRALTPTSVYYGQTTSRIDMNGTAAQTLEMVDTIPNLTISNNTSVTFTNSFKSLNAPVMSGTTTNLFIDGDFEVVNNSAWTIPVGVTVRLRNGSSVTTAGNVTVNGTLVIEAGGAFEIASGRTLSVGTTGLIQLSGTNGNPVSVETPSGGTFTFNVLGAFSGEYFRITRTSANGVNVTGDIQKMENGEFHEIANAGYGVTIGAAVTLPGTMDGMGFFDEGGAGSGNIDASAYAGSASDVTIDGWLGDIGGEASDLDTNGSCGGDPPGCIEWQTEASTLLTVIDNTAGGFPPNNIAAGSADTLFATYAFALTKADTASDITSLTFTQVGTASVTEVGALKVYEDTNGNCVYNAGTDTQIGADLALSGTPQQATVTIPPATVTVSNTTPICVHLVSSASSLGVRNNSISLEVSATADIVNSNSYSFSGSSGPPVNTGYSVITDGFASQWTGNNSTNSTTNNNWFLNDPPSATENCQIGEGERVCILNANLNCKTAELPASGELDFNGFDFNVYGNLTVDSGYTFTNAANRTFNMVAAVNQGVEIGESFPGDLVINNTGTAPNDHVIATGSSVVQGDVTITNGTLLIGNGVTFQVDGNITIQTGAELQVDAGGELILADGSSVTVDAGGTLTVVGDASSQARITSTGASASYTVTVNGTIAARYYTFSRLGGNGLTVSATATIDGTNHLQNGNFTYPVGASSTFIRLFVAVPTNTMDNMVFESAGSGATGITNIYTDAGIGAGTLVITTYSGDWSGSANDNDNTYLLSWVGETNTLDLAQDATAPGSIGAGGTVVVGRWSLEQSQPGASFSDTDITSFKVTMTGTANSSDLDSMKLYYDDNCDSVGGTLIGTQSPTGTPASSTFTIGAGVATVEADDTTPPVRCLYVEYDIASGASDGTTIGATLAGSGEIANSQSYAPSGSTSFPLGLGTGTITGSSLTIWTGLTSTDWFVPTNWTSGVPSATVSCEIPNAGNDPVINGGTGTAICNNVDITNGIVTFQNATSAQLQVYGNFENTGSVTQNDGTLIIRDDGATATDQRIESSSTISSISFNKTFGGNVLVGGGSTFNLTTLNFPASQNFTFKIQSGKTLSVGNSFGIPTGITFDMEGSSTLEMASGLALTVTGGTFQTSGVNDSFPQNTSNKATLTTSSGRFSFNASSGSVALQGFLINNIDVNGLQITGNANLTQLDGGQFTNLLADFATPVRAITLNTSTTITEDTASNIGFNWSGANSNYSGSPLPSDSYYLVNAPDCGSQSLSFSQWFGDFWGSSPQPHTPDKIIDIDDGAFTCTVSISAAASPVQLTEFSAIPFNGVVDVLWTTGSELDHQGFNVYRSLDPNAGFVQINSQLIQNITGSSTKHGDYAFRDQTVTNEISYFYYIEDVAYNGTTTMHGPVSATPRGTLAAAPPMSSYSGSDSISDDASDGSTEPGNVIEIAPDVHILSSSDSTMRIEIIPSAMTSVPSPWDGSYSTVNIPHFAHTAEAGSPELLERTILIPVTEAFTNVSFDEIELSETLPASLKIAPAPQWTLDAGSGQLVPSWGEDPGVYGQNAYWSGNYYQVGNNTVSVGNKNYISIKVWPLSYNPVAQLYKISDRIVIDIYTGGQAWEGPAAPLSSLDSPLNGSHVAILSIQKSGMYEVDFSDLQTFNVEGPFDGIDVSELRAYALNQEIPIEIDSADGSLGVGDKIRFYAPHGESHEDTHSFVVLSPRDLYNDGASMRIPTESLPYDGSKQDTFVTQSRLSLEENNSVFFDWPMGGNVDHYFWNRLYVSQGTSGSAATKMNFTVDLLNISRNVGETVGVSVELRGRGTAFSIDPKMKLAVRLNGDSASTVYNDFEGSNKQTLHFAIDADKFIDGENTVEIETLSDHLTGGSEWALVDIDKVHFDYDRAIHDVGEALIVKRSEVDVNIVATGFLTAPNVYDVSHFSQTKKVSGTWTPAGPEVSSYGFSPNHGFLSDINNAPIGIQGSQFVVLADDQFLSVDSIELGQGYGSSLKETSNQADYLMIGNDSQLRALDLLVAHRESQGFSVVKIELQQIYNEFSDGRRSSKAIKDFLSFAYNYWAVPKPKYVVLVGDSTLDPRNYAGHTRNTDAASAFLLQGEHGDYPSDVVLATQEIEENILIPTMAVGRLPSDDLIALAAFANKVISYELGNGLSDSGKRKLVFASDKSVMSEGFTDLTQNLQQATVSGYPGFDQLNIARDDYPVDSDLNNVLMNVFEEEETLLLTLNGHGAEQLWADATVFNTNNAESLTNTDSFPLVVTLNCLNGFNQFADPNSKGLGETLVMQEHGAVGFWGSTTMSTPRAQEALAMGFYSHFSQNIDQGNRDFRVGDAILHAQNTLSQTSGFQDVLLSWSFIGDPAMKLPEKVFPPVAQDSVAPIENEQESVGQENVSGRSRGCSLFAGQGDHKGSTPWDLFFGFLLEVGILLTGIRIISRLRAL